MVAHPRPLIEVLAAMPDCRHHCGKRHALTAMLALACRAMWCGDRSDTAIAEWGRNDGGHLRQALGFTRRPPCAATLHPVLRGLDREAFARQVGAWAEARLAGTPRSPDTEEAMAVDGKTLRGSKQPGAPGAPLLSALAPRMGLPLAQHAVAAKTNAIPAALERLRHLVLTGRVVTRDALVTQRTIAQQIVDAEGDSVLVVKDHQPPFREDSETVCAQPSMGGRRARWQRRGTGGMGASHSGGSRRVRCWWARVTGQGWRTCFTWNARSSSKRRGRSARKW